MFLLNVKVCHLTTVHQRYDGRILKKECVSLANNGYDVTLLVADNRDDEVYSGVKISSINFYPKSRFDRILNSKKYMFKKAVEVDADIYHFHDPELIPLGLKLAKLGKKVIYDSHEDYPEDIKYKKWLPYFLRMLLSFTFKLYEEKNLHKFSSVISVSPNIVKRLKKYNKSTYLITNYPILRKNISDPQHKKEQECICFTGLLSSLWMHENVLDGLDGIDVDYVVAGPIEKEYLAKLKSTSNGNKLKYMGLLPQNTAYRIQEQSIAGMAILQRTCPQVPDYGTLGNTKLFEYMQSRIPVICSDSILWREIIEKWQCGICVNPYNIKEISSAIQYILSHPTEMKSMGENGYKAVLSEYNWDTQKDILLSVYKLLINRE